jgi:Hypothetical glycosyl hydrolase family 15
MPRRHGAWLRYGTPLTANQVDFAIDNYQVAILQPWETAALWRLKSARPDMTVLCYKCLSSTRSYEPGPVFTSGVSYTEAESAGEDWFAHRLDGRSRIEWNTYSGHWQMAVWNEEYRTRWRDNVVAELAGSLWDGVMADNDVYDDYYGLCPPIEGGRTLADFRRSLDEFVHLVGASLHAVDKLLIPNIAESRRDPGRWARHAAYGGGFEEVWLAYGPDNYFDVPTVLAQAGQAPGPGLTIMRVASDGTDTHPNVTYGLAAFWVFGGGSGGAYAATAHDGYSTTPFISQYNWDLGVPLEEIRRRGNGRSRSFTNGWAAMNLNTRPRRRVTFKVPTGLRDAHGQPAPSKVTLSPHEGVLYVRETYGLSALSRNDSP